MSIEWHKEGHDKRNGWIDGCPVPDCPWCRIQELEAQLADAKALLWRVRDMAMGGGSTAKEVRELQADIGAFIYRPPDTEEEE